MSEEEILIQLRTILRGLLGDDSIELKMDTQRECVPNWDSFNYITFMVAVEAKFGVKFKAADIGSFSDVGAIVQQVARLRANS